MLSASFTKSAATVPRNGERNHEDNSRRARPTLVLGCQHQEDQQDRECENQYGFRANLLLLERHPGPLKSHGWRQLRPRQLLHQIKGLPGAESRRGFTGDRRGRVEVVTEDRLRTECLVNGDESPDRNHVAISVSDIKLPDIFRIDAELVIGLHLHLPRAAKLVEVVYVGRTQVSLQSAEQTIERNFECLGLGTVNLRKELRHVRPKGCVQIVQPGLRIANPQ